MKKILIIDGQGGMLGKQLVEDVKKILPESEVIAVGTNIIATNSCLLYTSPSPRDRQKSRMPSSA